MRPESGLRVQIDHKSEKWQWRHSLLTWHYRQIFLTRFCFSCQFQLLIQISCQNHHCFWSYGKFVYKGLTRNPEIGSTPVWVLPNIWRLEQVMHTKFGTSVSNRMLLNAANFQGYNFYRFWVIKGKPTTGRGKIIPPPPPPRLGLSYQV